MVHHFLKVLLADIEHFMNQASNDYAHDFDFIFQTFNQRARADTAKVVRAKFKLVLLILIEYKM